MTETRTTEYQDAIIRVCADQHQNVDRMLIWFNEEELPKSFQPAFSCKPISIAVSVPTNPITSPLQRLPPEMISMILNQLNIRSYLRFRQASQHTRIVASSTPEYQIITKHALPALCALLRTRISEHFTILDLFNVLTSRSRGICKTCNSQFGAYLYLPTLSRCCFSCMEQSIGFLVLTVPTLSACIRIPQAEIRRLVPLQLRTVANLNLSTPTPEEYQTSQILIPVTQALELIEVEHPIDHQRVQRGIRRAYHASRQLNEGVTIFQPTYLACTALPWYDLEQDAVEDGLCCTGCDAEILRLYREFRLRGVHYVKSPFRAYSRSDFLEHFEQCGPARKLWLSRDGGTETKKGDGTTE